MLRKGRTRANVAILGTCPFHVHVQYGVRCVYLHVGMPALVPIYGAEVPVGGAKVPVGGGDVPITGSVGLLVVPVAHMGSLHPLHGGKLNHSETILKSIHWKHLTYI